MSDIQSFSLLPTEGSFDRLSPVVSPVSQATDLQEITIQSFDVLASSLGALTDALSSDNFRSSTQSVQSLTKKDITEAIRDARKDLVDVFREVLLGNVSQVRDTSLVARQAVAQEQALQKSQLPVRESRGMKELQKALSEEVSGSQSRARGSAGSVSESSSSNFVSDSLDSLRGGINSLVHGLEKYSNRPLSMIDDLFEKVFPAGGSSRSGGSSQSSGTVTRQSGGASSFFEGFPAGSSQSSGTVTRQSGLADSVVSRESSVVGGAFASTAVAGPQFSNAKVEREDDKASVKKSGSNVETLDDQANRASLKVNKHLDEAFTEPEKSKFGQWMDKVNGDQGKGTAAGGSKSSLGELLLGAFLLWALSHIPTIMALANKAAAALGSVVKVFQQLFNIDAGLDMGGVQVSIDTIKKGILDPTNLIYMAGGAVLGGLIGRAFPALGIAKGAGFGAIVGLALGVALNTLKNATIKDGEIMGAMPLMKLQVYLKTLLPFGMGGAALGGLIGSIIPGAGTVMGAIIGAGIGLGVGGLVAANRIAKVSLAAEMSSFTSAEKNLKMKGLDTSLYKAGVDPGSKDAFTGWVVNEEGYLDEYLTKGTEKERSADLKDNYNKVDLGKGVSAYVAKKSTERFASEISSLGFKGGVTSGGMSSFASETGEGNMGVILLPGEEGEQGVVVLVPPGEGRSDSELMSSYNLTQYGMGSKAVTFMGNILTTRSVLYPRGLAADKNFEKASFTLGGVGMDISPVAYGSVASLTSPGIEDRLKNFTVSSERREAMADSEADLAEDFIVTDSGDVIKASAGDIIAGFKKGPGQGNTASSIFMSELGLSASQQSQKPQAPIIHQVNNYQQWASVSGFSPVGV